MNTDLHNNIVYICRDIERALGLPIDTPGYFIISNETSFAKSLAAQHENVLLISNDTPQNTWDLMKNQEVIDFVKRIEDPHIVVFKNTPQIERICDEHGWELLNPDAALVNEVEEKISQIEWLGPLAEEFLPAHSVSPLADVSWNDESFILQFNRAHTGSGTMLITSEAELQALQDQFPKRPVRTLAYIKGPAFTSNNIVTSSQVLCGNVNYQITGLAPFTDQPFATVGNDWALPHALLSDEQCAQYKHMVAAIGNRLRESGWKGLFGVDIMVDEETGRLYLIEINARQPASTTFESQLQADAREGTQVTTFEAHLLALLDTMDTLELVTVKIGAQMVKRVLHSDEDIPTSIISAIEEYGCIAISYENTTLGSDLLRIQTMDNTFMKAHNEYTAFGSTLASLLQ